MNMLRTIEVFLHEFWAYIHYTHITTSWADHVPVTVYNKLWMNIGRIPYSYCIKMVHMHDFDGRTWKSLVLQYGEESGYCEQSE